MSTSTYPALQYDFLLKNVGRMKDWTQAVKIKFLRLACEFDRERVPSILLFDRFPLDDALEVCQTWQNEQGVAVIQLKLGRYAEVCGAYVSVEPNDQILKDAVAKSLAEVSSQHLPSLIFAFDTFYAEVSQLLAVDREGITGPLLDFWYQAYDVYASLLEEVAKHGFLCKRFWHLGTQL